MTRASFVDIRISRAVILTLALVVVAMSFVACDDGRAQAPDTVTYVATVHPVSEILENVVGRRGKVIRLLDPSASPHTYEPRPSDASAASDARALFYVSDNLDGWAAKLQSEKKISLMGFLPEHFHVAMSEEDHIHCEDHHHHGHSEGHVVDPHFWTDPLTVKAILPGLVATLVEIDPHGADVYRANAQSFAAELDALNSEVAKILKPVAGEKVLLFHPSFQYLIERYDLEYAGSIEPFPGKEPTPRYLADMTAMMEQEGIRAVFTEPQLSPRPAEVLAQEVNLQVYELDPYGGFSGTEEYSDYLLYNARVLAKALQ